LLRQPYAAFSRAEINPGGPRPSIPGRQDLNPRSAPADKELPQILIALSLSFRDAGKRRDV